MRDRDRLREKEGRCQIGPRTKQQQEACVSASATIGAFLRYICRRDEANAKSKEWRAQQYGYGGDVVSAEQQAR